MAERHGKGEDSIYFAHEGACAKAQAWRRLTSARRGRLQRVSQRDASTAGSS